MPASSVTRKRNNEGHMKITTQMSDTWMRQYKDRTAGPLPNKRGRQPFVDLLVVRRFTLIYWDEVRTVNQLCYLIYL